MSTSPELVRATTRRTLTYTLPPGRDPIAMHLGGDTTTPSELYSPALLVVLAARVEHLTDYRAQGCDVHDATGQWRRHYRRGAPPAGSWANDLPEWLWQFLTEDVEPRAYLALAGPVCETCGYRIELSRDRVWFHLHGVPGVDDHRAALPGTTAVAR